MTDTTDDDKIGKADIPATPDLRQSLCHTLMAAGFGLLVTMNPFSTDGPENTFHSFIGVALFVGVALSWYVFSKRVVAWRKLPPSLRSRITSRPKDLKLRAVSHLLMSLLSMTLTALAYLSTLAAPDRRKEDLWNDILLLVAGIVGIAAVATFARTVRDLIRTRNLVG